LKKIDQELVSLKIQIGGLHATRVTLENEISKGNQRLLSDHVEVTKRIFELLQVQEEKQKERSAIEPKHQDRPALCKWSWRLH